MQSKDSSSGERRGLSEPQHKHHVVEDMIAGFGAGFMAVSLGFPLDVIKTRIQTSDQTNQKGGKSVWRTGRSIVQKEGVLGLYKGIASPLVTMSLSSSLGFTTYRAFREVYKAEPGWHSGNFLAGMSSGPVLCIISTSENHVRTQMQIDNVKDKRFRNSFHCFTSIVRHHGVPTLFRGLGITMKRDCAYLSSYFFVYEGVKGTLLQQENPAAIPLAGGAAGITAWLVAYPFDCVRAGLHGQCLSRGQTTTWQVLQTLLSTRGIRGLFQGVTPTLLRAPFVHSCRFTAYEGFLRLFRSLHADEHMRPTSAPPVFLKTR